MQIAQGCSAEHLESTITAAGGQTDFFQVHFLRLFFVFFKLASISKQSQKAVVPAH